MALLKIAYNSEALCGTNEFNLLLPNDTKPWISADNPNYTRPAKVLMLLHGYSGNNSDWITGTNIFELSERYNLAVIMPSGGNSFYIDRPADCERYATMVGDELLAYVRDTFGLSGRAEDTFIAGLSMGGYGAIRNGLLYSHNYSRIAAFSSALIINGLKDRRPGDESIIGNYAYYTTLFGDLKTVAETDINPEVLVRKKLAAGEKLPKIYMACGTEDSLLPVNREFRDFLVSNGIEPDYHESSGIHDWRFWNSYLEPAVKWMLDIE